MSTDLTRLLPPGEYLTIKVHSFKDDPYGEDASLHGLFTDKAEAERIAHDISLTYPDFLHTTVVPIQFGTIEQVAQAQGITHIEPATTETYAQIRAVVTATSARLRATDTPKD